MICVNLGKKRPGKSHISITACRVDWILSVLRVAGSPLGGLLFDTHLVSRGERKAFVSHLARPDRRACRGNRNQDPASDRAATNAVLKSLFALSSQFESLARTLGDCSCARSHSGCR
jgi:hypothetical protein